MYIVFIVVFSDNPTSQLYRFSCHGGSDDKARYLVDAQGK